jgi:hypothetical protein
MEISAEADNGNTTVTWEVTAPTTKVNWNVVRAAHELWNAGFGDHETYTWETLTAQQKLDLLGQHFVKVTKDLARSYHINDSMDDAKETAAGEADSNEIE